MNKKREYCVGVKIINCFYVEAESRDEAEQIVTTVRKNNVPVWYLMAKDEGHGFSKKKNVDFQFYATVMFIKNLLL